MSNDTKNHIKPLKYGDDMKNHPNYGDDTITIPGSTEPIVLNRVNHGEKVRITDDDYSDFGYLVLSLDSSASPYDHFTYEGTYGTWTIELNDGSLYRTFGQVFLMPDHYQY